MLGRIPMYLNISDAYDKSYRKTGDTFGMLDFSGLDTPEQAFPAVALATHFRIWNQNCEEEGLFSKKIILSLRHQSAALSTQPPTRPPKRLAEKRIKGTFKLFEPNSKIRKITFFSFTSVEATKRVDWPAVPGFQGNWRQQRTSERWLELKQK